MVAPLQGSLFGGFDDIRLDQGTRVHRTPLTRGAWVDLRAGWLHGADDLFDRLVDTVPWHAEQRTMYDRVVEVPRLLCFYGETDPLPEPILSEARAELGEYYRAELGGPFRTLGLCFYRDGRDSVAWHGDTSGRGAHHDTVVAILTLGTARPLLLRPRGGGPSVRFHPGHGDLLVMGGSCQRTWEHAVPKTHRTTGPRISIQFRSRDVH